ncbi:hypothetical protein X743_31190 [Mesorhizobium sp. LNHC252B00]|nr:hypothetical protein X743_31190 [Mesorhizobium sp. LNHC252B00]
MVSNSCPTGWNTRGGHGIRFVASPRHADVLLVTGPVTKNMREALKRTYDATPNPQWVVASHSDIVPATAAVSLAAMP